MQFNDDAGEVFRPYFLSRRCRGRSAKTAIVRNYAPPKSVKDLRKFLGLTNYFRKIIPCYSKIIQPLTKLLRKDVRYEWGLDQEKAFQELKNALIQPPILGLPDENYPFIIACDASDDSISFTLLQEIDGSERIIEYRGRGLRDAELNYSVSEKELLAIVVAVTHFHDYVGGGSLL